MNFLPHVASRIFNTPLAITPTKATVIVQALKERMLEGRRFTAQPARSQGFNDPMMSGSIIVIPIHGALVKRSTGMDALSGLTSYETIQAQMRSAINAGAAGILFDFDSPGGEVAGMLELSDEIFQARKQLPIWASANDMAASAGYALASAAEKVFITGWA